MKAEGMDTNLENLHQVRYIVETTRHAPHTGRSTTAIISAAQLHELQLVTEFSRQTLCFLSIFEFCQL